VEQQQLVIESAQTLPPALLDAVCQWTTTQRWYPGASGTIPTPWLVGRFSGTSSDGPQPVILFAKVSGVVLQIPLVLPAYAEVGHPEFADGAQSPDFWRKYLSLMGLLPDAESTDTDVLAGAKLLTGEQSNSSILMPNLRKSGSVGAILKILRTLTPGEHPDVAVPTALAATEFNGVPRVLGSLQANLPEFGITDLAIAAELIPNAQDGFEMAVEYAKDGKDFATLAADLGTTLSMLHRSLSAALPSDATLDSAQFVAHLRSRAATAIETAPVLAPFKAAIDARLDALDAQFTHKSAGNQPIQRIHGDFHLGQALHSPKGWHIIDFEGEPMSNSEERVAPDLPLRDVAGVLRSFDYAQAIAARQQSAAANPDLSTGVGPRNASEETSWAKRAKSAFLTGYQAELAKHDGQARDPRLEHELLMALMLDKALYEVAYEATHRPDWVQIPLAAVKEILETPA